MILGVKVSKINISLWNAVKQEVKSNVSTGQKPQTSCFYFQEPF